jgi:hypothetical protein
MFAEMSLASFNHSNIYYAKLLLEQMRYAMITTPRAIHTTKHIDKKANLCIIIGVVITNKNYKKTVTLIKAKGHQVL